jgi:hypothetical protein
MFEKIKNVIINGDVVDPALIKLLNSGKLTKKNGKHQPEAMKPLPARKVPTCGV